MDELKVLFRTLRLKRAGIEAVLKAKPDHTNKLLLVGEFNAYGRVMAEIEEMQPGISDLINRPLPLVAPMWDQICPDRPDTEVKSE